MNSNKFSNTRLDQLLSTEYTFKTISITCSLLIHNKLLSLVSEKTFITIFELEKILLIDNAKLTVRASRQKPRFALWPRSAFPIKDKFLDLNFLFVGNSQLLLSNVPEMNLHINGS